MSKVLGFLVAFLVLLSTRGFAASYYVSTSGSDSNSGSSAAPWRTISHAGSVAGAGDVVHVAAGTYTEQARLVSSGTSSAHITFVCDSKWNCLIRGHNYSSSYGAAVVLLNGSYIDVKNFDISDDGSRLANYGILGYGSGGYNLTGNYVHDLGFQCNGNGTGGIDPSGATASTGATLVAGNFVANIGPQGCLQTNAIYLQGYNMTAVNNIVYDVLGGSAFDIAHSPHNVTVAFNTVYAAHPTIAFYMGCDSSTCDYNTVTNNIVYGGAYGIESYQGDSGDPASHNKYDNNLFYNVSSICSFPGGGSLTCTNNRTGNPNFLNIGARDLRLGSGSAAIGKATSLAVPGNDYAGTTRVSPYDLGAYAYASTTGTIPTSSPTPAPTPTPAPSPSPSPTSSTTAAGYVSITSPANGATVASTFTLSAKSQTYMASAIMTMQVYVDGTLKYSASPVTNPATISTSLTLSSGSHTITVKSADSATNQNFFQTSITVNVSSASSTTSSGTPVTSTTSAGTITLSSPGNGAQTGTQFTVTATAKTYAASAIMTMQIYVDGVLKASSSPVTNPATINATLTVSTGNHVVTVKAGDSATNQNWFTVSSSITAN